MRILSGIIVVASLVCFGCLLPHVIGVIDGSNYFRFAQEVNWDMNLIDRYYVPDCVMIIVSAAVAAFTAIRAFMRLW